MSSETPDSDFEGAAESSTWVLPPLENCWFLTGPTACGKSPLALEVASRLNAEIISMDSMAIYRDMDIGTAKPSPDELRLVTHHLIDIVEPTQDFSVSSFVKAAHQAAAEIHSRNLNVLVCGGTPLYLKSLLRGLFLGPEADWDFRDSVEKDIEQFGEQALRDRLAQVDPLSVHRIHANDHRRMIRALEVARITGKPLSHWQVQFEDPAPTGQHKTIVLQPPRAWLHQQINARVDHMWETGLKSEVSQLLDKYDQLGRTAAQAVGYREVLEFLDGKLTEEETLEHIKAHTRQFARRQEIWFRGLDELEGLYVGPESQKSDLVDKLCTSFQSLTQQAN